ncbi:MAG: glucosamine-6-phosphate deaminase [Bacteroidota bacterium]
MKNFLVDRLNVIITENRNELGLLAAENLRSLINSLLQVKENIRMVFAAAPSQNEFLKELIAFKNIDWSKITAFNMDEYVSMGPGFDKLFSRYLNDNIFSKVKFRKVNLIDSFVPDIRKECDLYEKLLREDVIDIACMGIGENGHIAFNDPPVADFNDFRFVKVVELDNECRQQQVNDGCFNVIDEVPKTAITLTIPALISCSHLSVIAPGYRKAEAVRNTLTGDISTKCPASILRTHSNAVLYLDNDSSGLL